MNLTKLALAALMGFGLLTSVQAQQQLSWKTLEDVRFKTKYIDDLGAYYLIPKFGKEVSSYEGQEVVISGYFLPFDTQKMFFILSKYPMSSCYFCGSAGPETIVELWIKPEAMRRFRMDEQLAFKGTLVLNGDDFDNCNYILKNAAPL